MPPPLPPWELLETTPCELLEEELLDEELLDEEELEELDDGWVCEENGVVEEKPPCDA